jgi:hypothetical protein
VLNKSASPTFRKYLEAAKAELLMNFNDVGLVTQDSIDAVAGAEDLEDEDVEYAVDDKPQRVRRISSESFQLGSSASRLYRLLQPWTLP